VIDDETRVISAFMGSDISTPHTVIDASSQFEEANVPWLNEAVGDIPDENFTPLLYFGNMNIF
jgi:hypothetical protein